MNFKNYIPSIFVSILFLGTVEVARAEYGNQLYQLEQCLARLAQVEDILIQKRAEFNDLTLLAGVPDETYVDGINFQEAFARIQEQIRALEMHKVVLKRDIDVLRSTLLKGDIF